MAKTRSTYVCQNCGRSSPREMGKCPDCGEWNTMVETIQAPTRKGTRQAGATTLSQPIPLTQIEGDSWLRLPLPIEEFSRVLGGGIVPGSIVLIGGDPGIGKSTLMLQLAGLMADTSGPVLYVSGEESDRQLKMRAERLGIWTDNLYIATETHLDAILAHTNQLNPQILVVDSIQTTYTDDLPSTPGSISQVRESAHRLQTLAKQSSTAVFLVGHVTKEGTIAGPRVLEHIVDTVLYLEGDAYQSFRLLRCVKNRFGATSEVGVFEMQGDGLIEVTNPSEAFLAERMINASGSSIAITMEGTRPLLAEVQALSTITSFANPRRTANGIDFNRLLLVTAVLSKRASIRTLDQDIFVNVIGGLKINEPAADLAIATAIASSARDIAIPANLALVGEIGLSGELRAVSQLPARLNEAAKLGFTRALVPKSARRSDDQQLPDNIQIIRVRSLTDALDVALGVA